VYLTIELIRRSVRELATLHPFFGITYLVCKKGNIPIGRKTHFAINKAEEDFLKEYYKPDAHSEYYYHPFKTSGDKNGWIASKYPYSGSQSTRTRGGLSKAFLHNLGTDEWGWDQEYVDVLEEKLRRDHVHYVPVFWLAVWLFRNRKWNEHADVESVIKYLQQVFRFTERELKDILDTKVPKDIETPPTKVALSIYRT
jgi:hypothetical protein